MPKSPRRYYKGGFLPEMTRDEAARILGVRQTASEARIIAAHRKIMVLNHPDAGGSTFLATKINEAKDMLVEEDKN
jgi:DnaJ homolog subfamily C member 19